MNVILNERIRQSLTQKRLAHKAGIDARTLRKIEKDEDVSPDSRRAVCLALGIDPALPENQAEAARVDPVAASARTPRKNTVMEDIIWSCNRAAPLTVLLMAIYVGVGLMADSDPNAHLVTSLGRACVETDASDVAAKFGSFLTGSSVKGSVLRRGTTTCDVVVGVITDDTEAALLAKLANGGISARLEDYRKRAHPLG